MDCTLVIVPCKFMRAGVFDESFFVAEHAFLACALAAWPNLKDKTKSELRITKLQDYYSAHPSCSSKQQ